MPTVRDRKRKCVERRTSGVDDRRTADAEGSRVVFVDDDDDGGDFVFLRKKKFVGIEVDWRSSVDSRQEPETNLSRRT